MANDCINKVSITHTDKDLMDRFAKAYVEERLFQEFLPVPPNNDNPHNFKIQNWGTVKEIYETDMVDFSTDSEKSFSLMFSTAWTAPINFFVYLHEKLGFDVELVYFEYNSFVGGELRNSEVSHYDLESVSYPEEAANVVERFPEIEQDERYPFAQTYDEESYDE